MKDTQKDRTRTGERDRQTDSQREIKRGRERDRGGGGSVSELGQEGHAYTIDIPEGYPQTH